MKDVKTRIRAARIARRVGAVAGTAGAGAVVAATAFLLDPSTQHTLQDVFDQGRAVVVGGGASAAGAWETARRVYTRNRVHIDQLRKDGR